MLLWEKMNFQEEKKKINQMIINWSNGRKKFLNIISIPYNSTEIFVEIIRRYVLENKKILYITDEHSNKISIVADIKKYTNIKSYAYIKDNVEYSSSNLKICNFTMSISMNENFDLIIYDDISSFSCHNKYEILDILSRLSNKNNKTIVYSIEEVLRNAENIVLPVKNNSTPMVEPRTILTRVDINKGIPFIVYDYLRWSINAGRKVIIFVPDKDKVEKVSCYIKQYCSHFLKNIMCFVDNRFNEKFISRFLNIKDVVLVTNCIKEVAPHIENSDIMVYFADSSNFSYKDFIYLCGSVIRNEKDLKGEVIFLANCENKNMEKAKNMTRNFNKEAWNMGLLRV
ncbi:hypothetical protein ACSVC9_15635 [Clostridium sp. LBM24168]